MYIVWLKDMCNLNVCYILVDMFRVTLSSYAFKADPGFKFLKNISTLVFCIQKMLDETTISTNVPEIAVKVLPSPKPPTADKPKRSVEMSYFFIWLGIFY